MPKKEKMLQRLQQNPKDFTVRELDTLMGKCGCQKYEGGRGSSIGYYHVETKRVLTFDGPHPGKELYGYQIKMVVRFLTDIGEL